jgi:hypothetical protein
MYVTSFTDGAYNYWELQTDFQVYPKYFSFWLVISGEPSTFATTAITPFIHNGGITTWYNSNPDLAQNTVYIMITGELLTRYGQIGLPTNWIIADEPFEIAKVQITVW